MHFKTFKQPSPQTSNITSQHQADAPPFDLTGTAHSQQFRSIGASFTTCFDWLMGGVDFTIFQDTHNPQVGVILLLLYWCVLLPAFPKVMQTTRRL